MPAYAAECSRGRRRIGRAAFGVAVAVHLITSPTIPALSAPRTSAAHLPAPPDIPLPPPRPHDADESAASNDSLASEVPIPPPRPLDLAEPTPAATASQKAEAVAAETACEERLAKLGVRFEPLPTIVSGQCGAPHPLRVSHLPDGLEVSPPATLVCEAAEALARWTKEVVTPEAARHVEATPARIAIGTSYECRNQNHQASAKLSEHAFANGADVSGFEFKGRKAIQIGDHPAESPDALFQAAIRTQACSYFTTVLGPGSDPSHATHLHLDLRGRNHGYRICQ